MINHIRISGAVQSGKTHNMLMLYAAHRLAGADPVFVLPSKVVAKVFRRFFNVKTITLDKLAECKTSRTLLVDNMAAFTMSRIELMTTLKSHFNSMGGFCTVITSEDI